MDDDVVAENTVMCVVSGECGERHEGSEVLVWWCGCNFRVICEGVDVRFESGVHFAMRIRRQKGPPHIHPSTTKQPVLTWYGHSSGSSGSRGHGKQVNRLSFTPVVVNGRVEWRDTERRQRRSERDRVEVQVGK